MLSLKQQMQSYGAYHKDPRNKMTHFVGVPLVTFSLFLALGWFRFVHPEVPITAATIFYLGVVIYYLRLDWSVALLQLPFTLILLLVSDWVAGDVGAAVCSGSAAVALIAGWFVFPMWLRRRAESGPNAPLESP